MVILRNFTKVVCMQRARADARERAGGGNRQEFLFWFSELYVAFICRSRPVPLLLGRGWCGGAVEGPIPRLASEAWARRRRAAAPATMRLRLLGFEEVVSRSAFSSLVGAGIVL